MRRRPPAHLRGVRDRPAVGDRERPGGAGCAHGGGGAGGVAVRERRPPPAADAVRDAQGPAGDGAEGADAGRAVPGVRGVRGEPGQGALQGGLLARLLRRPHGLAPRLPGWWSPHVRFMLPNFFLFHFLERNGSRTSTRGTVHGHMRVLPAVATTAPIDSAPAASPLGRPNSTTNLTPCARLRFVQGRGRQPITDDDAAGT